MINKEFKLSEIANLLDLSLEGDQNFKVSSISNLQQAKKSDISFYYSKKFKKDLENTNAGAVILSKSDDLSGGEFWIKGNDQGVHPVPLEVGETLFFDSRTFHKVNQINKGTRDALVAWIWKK